MLGGCFTDTSVQASAREWIDYWEAYERTGKFPETDEDSVTWVLFRGDMETRWSIILEILRLIKPVASNPLFQSLAAGPLEDLLSAHGAPLIERVEILARRDPTFRLLLGGAWKNAMSQDVWDRVQRARVSSW